MSARRFRLAWYRFRVQGQRRWQGYLALILLLGLVGGVALGSMAGARATQSAFPTFLKSTNPSDLNIDNGTYDPALLKRVAALPLVTSVQTYVSLNIDPVLPNGTPNLKSSFGNLEEVGTLSKLYLSQDKLTIVDGRMLNPHRRNEVVVSKFAANLFGLHVGQRIPVGVYSNSEIGNEGLPTAPPAERLTFTIVGVGIFNDEVVQDDVDRIPRVLLSPALADPLARCCGSYAWAGVQVRHGSAGVAKVLHNYLTHLPADSLPYIHVTSVVEAQAEQAEKPVALALGIFGVIAGLAALLIGAQSIARLVRRSTNAREVMRAFGADPVDTAADGLLGIVVAVVLGSLLAAAVAIGLSPLAPFGAVRDVLPSTGLSYDWTVLGFGAACLAAFLVALAVTLSVLDAPHRRALRHRIPVRGSVLMKSAASAGLPTPAVVGMRFALEPARGRSAVPVRWALLSTLLAIVVVLAALTFGSSLNTLVSHPALYGWNWNYSLTANAGYGDIPLAAAQSAFAKDPSVSAWAGGYYSLLPVDGQEVPVLGWNPHAALGPSRLSGRGLEAANQVVLGTATLQALHKKVGDTVTVTSGANEKHLTIVGTATMPTIGVGHGLHLSMGTGALLDYHLIPALNRNIQQEKSIGPNVIFVRFKPGANPAVALRSLNQVNQQLNAGTGNDGNVLLSGVEHPGQIVDYRSMGSTPAILAAGLALGAVGAFGLTLGASVRWRRRDLALLKTLGFTRRQLAATVSWQASVAVFLSTLVGIPVGIGLGRWLWTLFARELYAVPQPSVPTTSIIVVALGALVLANLVAYVPAHRAARVPTAAVLRAE